MYIVVYLWAKGSDYWKLTLNLIAINYGAARGKHLIKHSTNATAQGHGGSVRLRLDKDCLLTEYVVIIQRAADYVCRNGWETPD